MGRTLKRVPFTFDWPLNQVWEGYLNPINPLQCEPCEGSGYSPEARVLQERWYGFDRPTDWEWCDDTHHRRWNRAAWNNNLDEDDIAALLKEDRLWDFTRVPRTEEQRQLVKQRLAEGHNSWLPESNGYVPTPQEVNEWNKQGLGHDSINSHIVIKAKCERLGYPVTCSVCKGDGVLWISLEKKLAYEAWEPTDPPTGDGYQLWETTTEGSPQSPVFSTLDALCQWCEEHATTFGDYTASSAEWKHMLSEDFVHHQEGNNIFI